MWREWKTRAEVIRLRDLYVKENLVHDSLIYLEPRKRENEWSETGEFNIGEE